MHFVDLVVRCNRANPFRHDRNRKPEDYGCDLTVLDRHFASDDSLGEEDPFFGRAHPPGRSVPPDPGAVMTILINIKNAIGPLMRACAVTEESFNLCLLLSAE
jgi:hypothetical protein